MGWDFFQVRKIKSMRVVNGRRLWTVAWAGQDERGKAWKDSEEPTRNVSSDMIDAFSIEKKEKPARSILVDVRPVDRMAQRTIAHAM